MKSKASKCSKCGGEKRGETCNLCELFAAGEVSQQVHIPGWPMVSDSLAVHPSQVEKATDRAKRHGINVEYQKNGMCRIPDARNYSKLLRLEGLHNKAEGYHGS